WAPQRSISYYNKGDLLGVMLDLAVRDASDDKASLREIFQWMNRNYAQMGKFFPDSDGVRQAAEAVSHTDLESFFTKYVAGTEQIVWNDIFKSVGLHLIRQPETVADLGFSATRTFGSQPVVMDVRAGSDAERGGLVERRIRRRSAPVIRTVIMLSFWGVLLPLAALICFPWTFLTGDISFLYRVGMWGAFTGVRLAGVRVQTVGLDKLDPIRTYIFMS